MTASPQQAALLVALSARPYVQALKQAGYYTVVIDGFLDQETRFFADEAYQIDFDGLGFAPDDFKTQLAQLAPCHHWLGCMYGAGVEAQSNLIKLVNMYMPLLGNTPQTLQAVNAPNVFFSRLATLSIASPAWQWTFPREYEQPDDRWLRKTVGGSGGGHIQFAKPADEANGQVYFQRELRGEPVSVLFLALPKALEGVPQAIMLGEHTQWEAATETHPYRLGGIVALDHLSHDVQQQLQQIIQKLTSSFELTGLNALDVVVQGAQVNVLELNPRLSLSLDLYLQDYNQGAQVNLLALHLLVCLFVRSQEPTLKQQIIHAIKNVMAYHKRLRSGRQLKAIAVVYAPLDVALKENIVWPEWVVDRPAKAGKIELNSPICSVLASAQTSALAKALALKRVEAIKQNAELISSN